MISPGGFLQSHHQKFVNFHKCFINCHSKEEESFYRSIMGEIGQGKDRTSD